MKRLVILGSTGSIGRQAIEVAEAYPNEFQIVGLAAQRNAEMLMRQSTRLRPRRVAIAEPEAGAALATVFPSGIELLTGANGVAELAASPEADVIVNGVVGFAGLDSTLAALRAGKVLALANKESLVVGGQVVLDELESGGGRLVPVDSEHSALFQCLAGEADEAVSRLILTGSGGPFRGRTAAELAEVSVEDALAHPTWSMGPKITVDSATLMNKGLEIIEAHYLFGIDYEHIEVMIHPESIVHSLVECVDGSVKAQLGLPDMRLPILYALSYPARLPTALPRLDLAHIVRLTFERPDERVFGALRLARGAGALGKTYPAVLNAANEVAVARFLEGAIRFIDIVSVVEQALEQHDPLEGRSVAELKEADEWARAYAGRLTSEARHQ